MKLTNYKHNREDKAVQVVIGLKKPLRLSTEVQTNSKPAKTEQGTQCGTSRGSYNRNKDHDKWRYDDLMAKMVDKEILIEWLMAEGMLAKSRSCPTCGEQMHLTKCEDKSDGVTGGCRKEGELV